MNVRITEQILPGIGRRYDVSAGDGQRLVVVVQRQGGRQVAIADAAGDPTATIMLSHDQAIAVAALLTGARFSIETGEPEASASADVAIDTVTLGDSSPAIGRLARDVPLLSGSDAAILAVIRDDTPELVEDDHAEPCRPGDRVVLAARRDLLTLVARELAGGTPHTPASRGS